MTNYVEKLRTSLDEAKLNLAEFMTSVGTSVMLSADIVLRKYQDTGVYMTTALADPWNAAMEGLKTYQGEKGLVLMNAWTAEGGFFDSFNKNATVDLKAPWQAGTDALTTFKTNVDTQMKDVVRSIQLNVSTGKNALAGIAAEINKINDTPVRVNTGSGSGGGGGDGGNGIQSYTKDEIMALQRALNLAYRTGLTVDGIWGGKTTQAIMLAQKQSGIAATGKYDMSTQVAIINNLNALINSWKKQSGSASIGQGVQEVERLKKNLPTPMYAKGTLGTKKDEWAITNELGDELAMYATPQGTLSFMRLGSTVVPADLTSEIVDIAKLGVDGLTNMPNISGAPNLNMINNVVNKPEFNLSFEALVKADRIDEGTLPEVKRFVQQEINSLVKQMNYALKGVGSR